MSQVIVQKVLDACQGEGLTSRLTQSRIPVSALMPGYTAMACGRAGLVGADKGNLCLACPVIAVLNVKSTRNA